MKNPYATDFSHTNLCLRPNLQTEQEWGINMELKNNIIYFRKKKWVDTGTACRTVECLCKCGI